MKEKYFESILTIERLHHLFLDIIKFEIERLRIFDISNVQILILYNIGVNQLTVGELTQRGYYMGSNVSYNLRKMVQNDYILQVPSQHDRRSSYVRLSAKGLEIYKRVDKILQNQAETFSQKINNGTSISDLHVSLQKMEKFWQGILSREQHI